MRAIAKIAFNYFTHEFGTAAYNSNFDNIRNYIRHGITPRYYVIELLQNKKIIYKSQANESTGFGHVIRLKQNEKNGVIAQVVLFNTHIFKIILSQNYPLSLVEKGSFFDISNRLIKTHFSGIAEG